MSTALSQPSASFKPPGEALRGVRGAPGAFPVAAAEAQVGTQASPSVLKRESADGQEPFAWRIGPPPEYGEFLFVGFPLNSSKETHVPYKRGL